MLPSSRARDFAAPPPLCLAETRCTRTRMTSWLEASEPEITSLQFADSFSDTSVKLFEMDDKVLEELLADGGRRA